MHRVLAMIAAMLLPAAMVASASAAAAGSQSSIPTAHATIGRPTVGPLFPTDDTGQAHFCTASVLHSPAEDLILTAAHCVHAGNVQMAFVPGYDNGRAPYGVWHTTGAYLDPHWLADQDPQYDYALLTVAPQHRGRRAVQLEQVTGSNRLGEPLPGTAITDVAYNAGVGGTAVECSTTLGWSRGFPTFACHGFVGGSSGSPWITVDPQGQTFVVGVIGGWHQGGCDEARSYASAFGPDITRLAERANDHGRSDIAPSPDDDGC